jgi:hypothetical protein
MRCVVCANNHALSLEASLGGNDVRNTAILAAAAIMPSHAQTAAMACRAREIASASRRERARIGIASAEASSHRRSANVLLRVSAGELRREAGRRLSAGNRG